MDTPTGMGHFYWRQNRGHFYWLTTAPSRAMVFNRRLHSYNRVFFHSDLPRFSTVLRYAF